MGSLTWVIVVSLPLLLFLYVLQNDRAFGRIPKDAAALSPERITSADTVRRLTTKTSPSIHSQLPPKTGRRYIIVGGSGFVGGWIVLHLLERGEDPRQIRIVDIRPPVRPDLTSGPAKDVQFVSADICDAESVKQAFGAPWSLSSTAPITVFHTAAKIGFYERHPSLLPGLAKVNVQGTQNVIDAAVFVGATALVYTSSASVAIHRTRWLWPWETEPINFFQVLNDDDSRLPRRDQDFFSNYGITKIHGERLVRAADGTTSGSSKLRTGCLRPGNAVYGPGGDLAHGSYLKRKANVSWILNIMQNFIYVENVSLAHLRYEERLICIAEDSTAPNIGGQAFMITDSGPPRTHGDLAYVLTSLTNGETTFPKVSATVFFLLAHLVEFYVLTRQSVLSLLPFLRNIIPAVKGDLLYLQPAGFFVMMAHVIVDDSRARLPPEKGGLGYNPPWDSCAGVRKTVEEYKKSLKSALGKEDVLGLAVTASGPQGNPSK